MATKRYRVVRPHEGDRMYQAGEERVAAPADVKHLVPHVLEPIEDEPAEKAEPATQNKAEASAPENKAQAGRKTKGE